MHKTLSMQIITINKYFRINMETGIDLMGKQ